MDEFHYNSIRAKKARLGGVLNNPIVRFAIWLLLILGISGFVYLMLFAKRAEAWLCLPIAMLSGAILLWSKSDLKRVPLGKTSDINDILSANVLRVLDRQPTPEKFVDSLYKTWSGKVLAVRFGITREFLKNVAKEIPKDMAPIFQYSREIREKINAEVVSGGMIGIAI